MDDYTIIGERSGEIYTSICHDYTFESALDGLSDLAIATPRKLSNWHHFYSTYAFLELNQAGTTPDLYQKGFRK
ncbi:hypothetical protein [Solemya velum gill symbiont]|uniref:hypothetical protein n=1 Tax=Solemya velum gill symbiont TaxID=2340 RepID=UPI00117B1C62|nr:hypothetical protein [Solemya velum gill symbiont]